MRLATLIMVLVLGCESTYVDPTPDGEGCELEECYDSCLAAGRTGGYCFEGACICTAGEDADADADETTGPDGDADADPETAADSDADADTEVEADADADVGEEVEAEADVPPAECGNGIPEPGEECDGDPDRPWETPCGTMGIERCGACRWYQQLPDEIDCNFIDDDCNEDSACSWNRSWDFNDGVLMPPFKSPVPGCGMDPSPPAPAPPGPEQPYAYATDVAQHDGTVDGVVRLAFNYRIPFGCRAVVDTETLVPDRNLRFRFWMKVQTDRAGLLYPATAIATVALGSCWPIEITCNRSICDFPLWYYSYDWNEIMIESTHVGPDAQVEVTVNGTFYRTVTCPWYYNPDGYSLFFMSNGIPIWLDDLSIEVIP